MALKDDVLKNFFTKTSKPLETQHSSSKINQQFNIHRHRVFDDPLKDDNTYEHKIEIIKTDFKVASNELQSDFKPASNRLQSDFNKSSEKSETDFKVTSKLTSQVASNRLQSDLKVASGCSFFHLTGVQRNLILFVFNQCKKTLSKTTEPLTIEYLSEQLNCPKKTVKTSSYRLEKRGLLHRVEYRDGRRGWTRYELPIEVYNDVMQTETSFKVTSNWLQTDFKVASELTSELTSKPSSSSSDINTTTTELSNEWKKIDISLLESIGLNFSHLTQLQRSEITSTEIVQDSINHFAYDLIHNNKSKEIKTTPIGYFMGIMKRAGLYTAPENYESEKDRTLRIYMETKKRQQEKQAAIEAELIDLSYNEWNFGLTEDEKKSLLPDHILNSKLDGPKIAALKTYFKKNIWPEKSKIEFKKQVKEV